jgi:hypothetical protein
MSVILLGIGGILILGAILAGLVMLVVFAIKSRDWTIWILTIFVWGITLSTVGAVIQ